MAVMPYGRAQANSQPKLSNAVYVRAPSRRWWRARSTATDGVAKDQHHWSNVSSASQPPPIQPNRTKFIFFQNLRSAHHRRVTVKRQPVPNSPNMPAKVRYSCSRYHGTRASAGRKYVFALQEIAAAPTWLTLGVWRWWCHHPQQILG